MNNLKICWERLSGFERFHRAYTVRDVPGSSPHPTQYILAVP